MSQTPFPTEKGEGVFSTEKDPSAAEKGLEILRTALFKVRPERGLAGNGNIFDPGDRHIVIASVSAVAAHIFRMFHPGKADGFHHRISAAGKRDERDDIENIFRNTFCRTEKF